MYKFYCNRKFQNIISEKLYKRVRKSALGVLKPNSTSGVGFITEHITYKILNDCINEIDISISKIDAEINNRKYQLSNL